MAWILLIAGVALWAGAHLFKRLAPARRAGMGDAGKGLVALLLLGSVVLMVLGYRWTDFIPVWNPPSFFIHINNVLMILSLYLFSPAAKRGALIWGMRHPMLTGFKTWAIAHLLVNGDLASIILFGGLLAWAVYAVIAINRAEPEWKKPGSPGTLKMDAIFGAASVVLLVVVGWVHGWLGPWPFPS